MRTDTGSGGSSAPPAPGAFAGAASAAVGHECPRRERLRTGDVPARDVSTGLGL